MVSIKNKEDIIAESIAASHLYRLFPDSVYFWKNSTEIDAVINDNGKLYGFEIKCSDNPEIKLSRLPSRIKRFAVLSKKTFRKDLSQCHWQYFWLRLMPDHIL